MNMLIVLSLIILITFNHHHHHLASGQSVDYHDNYNYSPVIGILTMPIDNTGNRTSPSNFPSSYAKFIESAGGRVIPVMVGKDEDYYAKMISVTSGMLLTGGTIDLTQSIFTKSAYLIWKLTLKTNDDGQYYPLWGTCQGFEFFLYAVNQLTQWPLVNCKAENLVQPLKFIPNQRQLKQTKLFKSAPNQIIKILADKPVTYNAHDWCLPANSMDGQFSPQIGHFFNSLAKSLDSNGLEFISVIESINYPIYGVQFHPEKPVFEPVISPERSNTPHSFDSILIGQYFGNFFINEARKSGHRFPDHDEQYRAQLIYNYCPQYTALNASATNEQIYYFN